MVLLPVAIFRKHKRFVAFEDTLNEPRGGNTGFWPTWERSRFFVGSLFLFYFCVIRCYYFYFFRWCDR